MRVETPSVGPSTGTPSPAMASQESPPVCELSVSAGIEDPSAELALAEIVAARLGKKIRVLVAGAAGCSALALLSKSCVAEVHAVDLNAAQIHLVDLKRCAISCLSRDEQIDFFEANDDVSKEHRQQLYAQLRPELSDKACVYWDAHLTQIAYGVGRVGKFENLLFELRKTLDKVELDPLNAPAQALGSTHWNRAFHRHFEKSRLAQSLGSAWVGYTERDVPAHFAASMANGLRRFTAAKTNNYILQSAFKGKFTEGQMPLWLDEKAQKSMRTEGLSRLHLHVGPFLGTMASLGADEPFDLIVTSSLGDSLPFAEMHRLYTQAHAAVIKQGAVLARRLTSHRPLARAVQKCFTVDAALSAKMQQTSLSCVHDELVIGFA